MLSSYRSKTLAIRSIPESDAPKSKHQVRAEKQAMKTVRAQDRTAAKNAAKAAEQLLAPSVIPSPSAPATPTRRGSLALDPPALGASTVAALDDGGPKPPTSPFAEASKQAGEGFSSSRSAELDSGTALRSSPASQRAPMRASAPAALRTELRPQAAAESFTTVALTPAPSAQSSLAPPPAPARGGLRRALSTLWQRAVAAVTTAARWTGAQATRAWGAVQGSWVGVQGTQAWVATVAKAGQWQAAAQNAFRR